jgi:hypothetical protein
MFLHSKNISLLKKGDVKNTAFDRGIGEAAS